MASGLTLLLVGATGAVGTAVLEQALEWREIRRIVAPTRRPLSRRAAKLDNPVLRPDCADRRRRFLDLRCRDLHPGHHDPRRRVAGRIRPH
jgi:hypothetical protein